MIYAKILIGLTMLVVAMYQASKAGRLAKAANKLPYTQLYRKAFITESNKRSLFSAVAGLFIILLILY